MKTFRLSKTNLRAYFDKKTYYHYSIGCKQTSADSVNIFGVTYYSNRA